MAFIRFYLAVVSDDDLGRISEGDEQFHGHRFESLDLLLPADGSGFDVHGALEDDKVREYVILSTLICRTLNTFGSN
jgi:hypothetical protein